jgi:hypothetical protein
VAYLQVLAKKHLHLEPTLLKSIVGISSALKPYQVAWHLTQGLKADFKREEDLCILMGKEKQSSYFQNFSCLLPELDTVLNLVQNKGSDGSLIPEHARTFDYFLLYDEIPGYLEEEQLLQDLRNLKAFTMVLGIKADEKLRSKQHLVF